VDEINLDASTAIGFVAEGSSIRQFLKATVTGKQMVMTHTAEQEFQTILTNGGGVIEKGGLNDCLQGLQLSRTIPQREQENSMLPSTLERTTLSYLAQET
jgi:hypothetical protein